METRENKRLKAKHITEKSMEEIMRMIENNEFSEVMVSQKEFLSHLYTNPTGKLHWIKDRKRRVMKRNSS